MTQCTMKVSWTSLWPLSSYNVANTQTNTDKQQQQQQQQQQHLDPCRRGDVEINIALNVYALLQMVTTCYSDNGA